MQQPVRNKFLPGLLRGQVRLRRCWVIGFDPDSPKIDVTMAPEAEAVATPRPTVRSATTETVVLRASAAFRFLDADHWKRVRASPAATLREWIARADSKLLLAIRDTWGWQAFDECQVFWIAEGDSGCGPYAARAWR